MGATRVLLATAVLVLGLAVGVPRHDLSAQEEDQAGGVNPASEALASNAAVQTAWGASGLTFTAYPVPGTAPGGGGAGTSRARMPSDIKVYDYSGTQLMLTLPATSLGSHTLSAVYSGDLFYGPNQDTTSHLVEPTDRH